MRIFILEDDPNRIVHFNAAFTNHDTDFALDVSSAKALFNPPYDLICLDHDLGGEHFVPVGQSNTGSAFASYLTGPDIGDAIVWLHSHNPDGARAMYLDLGGKGAACFERPFNHKLLPSVLKLAEHMAHDRGTLPNA